MNLPLADLDKCGERCQVLVTLHKNAVQCTSCFSSVNNYKLDRVGPVDNRSSTKKLKHLIKKIDM